MPHEADRLQAMVDRQDRERFTHSPHCEDAPEETTLTEGLYLWDWEEHPPLEVRHGNHVAWANCVSRIEEGGTIQVNTPLWTPDLGRDRIEEMMAWRDRDSGANFNILRHFNTPHEVD